MDFEVARITAIEILVLHFGRSDAFILQHSLRVPFEHYSADPTGYAHVVGGASRLSRKSQSI